MAKETLQLSSPVKVLTSAIEDFRANWKSFIGFQFLGVLLVVIPIGVLAAGVVQVATRFQDLANFTMESTEYIDPAILPRLLEFLTEVIKNPFFIIGLLLLIIAAIVYEISFIRLISGREAKEEVSIKESFAYGLKNFPSYFWVAILVNVVIILGLLLLVVPGLFLAAILAFYGCAFVISNKRGIDTLRDSKNSVMKNFWGVVLRLLFIGAISYLISLVPNSFTQENALTAIISILYMIFSFIWPSITMLYMVKFYRELQA